MKFGIFYEHQLPRPWEPGAELRLFQDALDQVELADREVRHERLISDRPNECHGRTQSVAAER